jgi:hypothetical protein
MTDTQLLTVAITLLAIFIAMLVNNQRMTDLRTDVGQRLTDTGRRIDDLGAVLRAEMRADRLETNGKLDAILSMMAGMDQRVTKLEERPR